MQYPLPVDILAGIISSDRTIKAARGDDRHFPAESDKPFQHGLRSRHCGEGMVCFLQVADTGLPLAVVAEAARLQDRRSPERLQRRDRGGEEEAYREVATRRLSRVRRLDASALATTTAKRAEPRVPFGQVVERAMLRPGEELYSMNNRHKAKVRADGSLIGNDVKGSIHQVGAALEGAPSCNGWTYWHFRRDGQMIPIDILRQQIRSELAADG